MGVIASCKYMCKKRSMQENVKMLFNKKKYVIDVMV